MARHSNGESTFSRVKRILSAFTVQQSEMTISELAANTGMTAPTVSRLVSELVEHGWLVRGSDRGVRIGVRLWEIAARTGGVEEVREVAMPVLSHVHTLIGHQAYLTVRDGRDSLLIDRLVPPGSQTKTCPAAGRLALHDSGSGLALLASAPRSFQQSVLTTGLPTSPSSIDPHQLRVILSEVRRRGVAVVAGVLTPDLTEVAASIRTTHGEAVAAVSVMVPVADVSGVVPIIRQTATTIERLLAPTGTTVPSRVARPTR